MSIVDMRKTQPLDSQIYYINMSFDQLMGYVREYIDGLDDQFPATLFEVGRGDVRNGYIYSAAGNTGMS
ncbi:Hypothetical protein CpCap5W_0193 [Corynebacterium pseudotuberculosis]|uniref:Uncharacterized protein n=1 Tax=Corynebacterium pseudotuberculosis (strain C231) TaxID=681645 RepID=D9QDV1_CORP2|nr:hypothetical protein CPC231_00910 [Corynebacterium pseudotuberculosis C231]ADL20080.1 hypothetical protein CP1002_00910 [Corynebacterium pseudotuberculosis 1002]ADO25471.1 hypothetical protein CPI19_00910 [Corynebacterium pseudotuberculosis I19]AEK91519.1 Hypothetical protein CpPAT10_0179 [Corynebacterium pseudotuberculosis PAT10]AEP69447.1 Hypothetical protein Cp4202_0174 [Corynebacterium pseudotuberculosis 42/02-A]AFF21341.1 Hypothetical protein CpP54B96_0181 [Corynebacterium pseudotuberc